MTGDTDEKKTDILVISDDVAGSNMAGPGIRAWEISRSLSNHFTVTLAVPDYSTTGEKDPFFDLAPFEVFRYSLQKPGNLLEWGRWSRILLFQGYVLSKFPGLADLPVHLISDIYVPFVFENLFNQKWRIPSLKDREDIHSHDLRVFNQQMLSADCFLCANSRQRDLFTGSLMSLSRINPRTFDLTPGLEELILTVPFGLTKGPDKESGKDFLKETFPGIEADDTVFLWGGVLTNWFDPLTLIRATAGAVGHNPKIKVLFLSTIHANPLLPEFDMAKKAVRLSDELGLTDKNVFFNHGWVSYNQRDLFFSASDIGLSLNLDHFENRYAARTRMLDYLKYGLPILCTEGDEFSAAVEKNNLGFVVKPGDRTKLEKAMLTLAGEESLRLKMKRNIGAIRDDFLWERTTEPLVAHCRKVLDGQIKNKIRPSPEQLRFVFFPDKESIVKKTAKRLIWKQAQRLPHRLTTRLKRLLKT